MGYAMPTQISSGIHFRQYSRAFIMADSLNKTSVVFINADVCMGSQIMKMQVFTGTDYFFIVLIVMSIGHKETTSPIWRQIF